MINIKTRSFINKRLIKQKIRNLVMLTRVLYVVNENKTKRQQFRNNVDTRNDNIFTKSKHYFLCSKRERERERARSFDTEMVNTVTLFNIWMLKRFEWEARSPLTAPEGKLHAAVENFEHGKV